MVAFIESDDFLDQLGNLNVTEPSRGEIRHYHIHLKESEKGLNWVLKGGATIGLEDIRDLPTT